LWSASHRDAWRRIVDFVHRHSPAKIALQLGHAGRKGSTQLGWQAMDRPLPAGNWPLISASAAPYFPGVSQTPRAMSAQDFERVTAQFVEAARLGADAGFDMLELHMAHGYLLASFLSPLTNQRSDDYGGPVENRLRYPLKVLRAVRAVWPAERPLSVRISAHDWAPGGLDEADLIAVARAFKNAGAAALSVSTGQTVPEQRPVYGRMWQTPFADMIRNVVGIPTIAVGNIFEPDHVNTIIGAGRADLCAVARPHLSDPAWTLHAAASQRYAGQWWPDPYLAGKSQLEHNLERAALAAGAV
jgi:anthraniloyl-CoA monooxygenase